MMNLLVDTKNWKRSIKVESYKLYLPVEQEQDVYCDRYRHMLGTLDIVENEVRTYICGVDFTYKDIGEQSLPFVTINGKAKSYENVCKVLGFPHLVQKPNHTVRHEGVYDNEFD